MENQNINEGYRNGKQMVHDDSIDLSTDKQPWKLIYQNIRALITEESKKKIDFFKEYVLENKIIIMNFTETWFDQSVNDEAVIENYNIFRGDRVKNIRGGTAIYLHEKIEGELIDCFSENKCDMIAIKVPSLNLVNIVSYRPPKTKMIHFKPMLEQITNILNKLERPDPTIIWSGDFNFPFVKWKECNNGGCSWYFDPCIPTTRDEKAQFRSLYNICSKFNLMQTIDEPTRGNNTLDLIFTNEIDVIRYIDINYSSLSDHFRIELTTALKTEKIKEAVRQIKERNGLKMYNFFSKKVNWTEIKNELSNIDWDDLFNDKNTSECTEILNRIINEICKKHVPLKGSNSDKKRIPRRRKQLLGRIKKLKKGKRKAYSNEKKNKMDKKIAETEKELIEDRRKEKIEMEKQIVENIHKNPKLLFSYARSDDNRINEIGPFKKEDKTMHTGEEICNMLVDEFKKQLADVASNIGPDLLEEMMKLNDNDLADIIFNEDDIEKAIEKLKENSGPGPDDIPAIFLIKTSNEIKKPLMLILRKSIDKGEIPDIYKMAYITPIHKGGKKSKSDPANYRPISITSHIMKIYEKIIAKNIIAHLTENHLFNDNQHGFVPGRGTQSQLLLYYKDIYDSLQEGKRIDTVFLDFARAFDKVDHEILMQKIVKHKIKGKIACWLMEFLNNRKFRVLANKTMSGEVDVTSGVPQGTVLAALLFIIMISDIDENIRESIVRSFADDTRISKVITHQEDMKIMQDDLEVIYEWATNNKMKFNSDKFDTISYGKTVEACTEAYKNPEGEIITSDSNIRDLGITCSKDLQFKEHIDEIVAKSKRMSGMILRTFITRERKTMMQLFNTYIRSRLEYCSVIWSPSTQRDINKIEGIQRSFTARIDGMENFNYHQRLRELKTYSLERRRERYLIIFTWEMIEGKRDNILDLKFRKNGRKRMIFREKIPWATKNRLLLPAERNLIYSSTRSKAARLFNILPPHLANMSGMSTDTFKRHLDCWLSRIPDQPKVGNYSSMVGMASNSLEHQHMAVALAEG